MLAANGQHYPGFGPQPGQPSYNAAPQANLSGPSSGPNAGPSAVQPQGPAANTGVHSASLPLSTVKTFQAYFTKDEISKMVESQAGKMPLSRVEATRQQACAFMDKVGIRLGFPRRTIACAQLLYHRFHLYFPVPAYHPLDVSQSALLLASKLEDTLKKLREIQTASWHVRNMLEGNPPGPEPDAFLESEKSKLMGIERLLLECVCFDFGAGRVAGGGKDVFSYVVAFGRRMGARKELVKIAFKVAVDAHRTLVGLIHPPHTIALACLYLASFLDPTHPIALQNSTNGTPPNSNEAANGAFGPGWAKQYESAIDDVEDVCHSILDLFISLAGPATISASAPRMLSFPPPSPSGEPANPNSAASVTASDLTQLKIRLRTMAEERPPEARPAKRRRPQPKAVPAGEGKEVFGRDDVTVRFLFAGQGPSAV